MSLPGTAQTKIIIGGKPEGPDLQISFQWANEQGKFETKTGTVIGSQIVQTISNEDGVTVLGSNVYLVADVPGDGSYGVGPGGAFKAA